MLVTIRAFQTRRTLLLCLLLALVTLVLYWPTLHHNFLDYDDQQYVTENPRVEAGITGSGIVWAFTTNHASNWHPLTWLSHMLDCQIYGLNPLGHHLTNLLLHIANTILIFLLLQRMTGSVWPSVIVAALFAMHPAHVQSVAWVAERKDVLSTCFGLLAMVAYVKYARSTRPWPHYALALFLFACALMAKPMLVTLPFLLLLLDYWPLNRILTRRHEPTTFPAIPFHRALLEKIPFLFLTGISCGLTLWAQQAGHAVVSSAQLPFAQRLPHVLVSYLEYIGKAFLPIRLAVFYPFENPAVIQIIAALLVLSLVTGAVLLLARARPYLLVGWLWFLGMLVPVIGFIQAGDQSLADRYTYLPFLGLFIMAAWGVFEIRKNQALVKAFAILLCLGAAAWSGSQLPYWRDTRSLFEHAAAVTKRNYVAAGMLGSLLAREGNYTAASRFYSEALGYNPDFPEAHFFLGNALDKQGRWDEAMSEYTTAIRLRPAFEPAHLALGIALAKQGRIDDARAHYFAVLKFNPDSAAAHNDLAKLYHLEKKLDAAAAEYSRALELDPKLAAAHNNLGIVFLEQGKPVAGAGELKAALHLEPGNLETQYNLVRALNESGHWDESAPLGEQLAKARPNDPNVAYQWGVALANQKKSRDALSCFAHALLLNQDFPEALDRTAWILATDPHPEFRNGTEAVKMALRANELTENANAGFLLTLAAAYAEAGQFSEAITAAQKARELAATGKNDTIAAKSGQLLELFRSHQPNREN